MLVLFGYLENLLDLNKMLNFAKNGAYKFSKEEKGGK